MSTAPAKTRDQVRNLRAELPKLAWTAAEIAAQLGVKYEAALELIKNEMGFKRNGRQYLVPTAEFNSWYERWASDLERGEAAS